MKETEAARRYSRALFLAVRDKKAQLADIQKQVQAVAKLLRADPALERDLSHPLRPFERRRESLKRAAEKLSLSPLTANFFDLLLRRRRIGLLPLILAWFERQTDEAGGVVKAYVKSAEALDDKAKKELEKRLTEIFKKNTVIETSVDPELLAGLVVRSGDVLIDNSLKAQLRNLKQRLENGY